tara:strand:+ start:13600 stop:14184 length:585 start_codon:yes stop_codon:yes gene_type:complete
MKRKLILGLAFFITITSCKKIIDSAGNFGGEDAVKIEDLKIISVADKYTMAVPEYMTELKSLNDDASFQYANIYKETYTIVINENKQDFIDAFKEIEIYNDSLSPLDNYSDYQIKSTKESMDNGEYKKLNTKIRNLDSNQYEVSGKTEGIDVNYFVSFIESDEDVYMIMSWTLKNRYKKYKNTFKLIQNSFKIK